MIVQYEGPRRSWTVILGAHKALQLSDLEYVRNDGGDFDPAPDIEELDPELRFGFQPAYFQPA